MKKITVPAPLIIVVEDVGWWSGVDGSNSNQPFRTGMNRAHCPEDYQAVVLLGKELGTQVVAGFVWCEWDRNNLLKKIPSATWMGEKWENPVKKTHLYKDVVEIINNNLNHIETGFHGLGHEFWEKGLLLRTEFHDSNGDMRKRKDIEKHFEVFEEIYKHSGIKAPLPEIFIPPGLKHSFGNNDSGFQKILHEFGFRYVITVFDKAKKYNQPRYEKFTKECGVTLIERGLSPVKWNEISANPVFSFEWPVLSLHWSNILHFNPGKNSSVVKRWADYLINGIEKNGLIILPNAKESIVQLIYSKLAEIKIVEEGVIITLENAADVLPDAVENYLYIKTEIKVERPVNIEGGKILSIENHGGKETLIKIKATSSKKITLTFR